MEICSEWHLNVSDRCWQFLRLDRCDKAVSASNVDRNLVNFEVDERVEVAKHTLFWKEVFDLQRVLYPRDDVCAWCEINFRICRKTYDLLRLQIPLPPSIKI